MSALSDSSVAAFFFPFFLLFFRAPKPFQNDRSLFPKRQVTFPKTTGHFSQNDGSLFSKRRVTFLKTTGRFFFLVEDGIVQDDIASKTNCENTYNYPLSRVRARTHYRSFIVFAVTSVTGLLITC